MSFVNQSPAQPSAPQPGKTQSAAQPEQASAGLPGEPASCPRALPGRGALCVLAAALLFSLGGMLVKLVPWHPMAIGAARSVLAGAILLSYMKLRRHRLVVNRAVLLGGFAMGATSTLYVLATKMTTAADAILLQYTAPVWIILLMAVLFRVRPTKIDLAATAVLLCGAVLFFLDSLGGGALVGNILAVLSGVTWAGVFMMKQWEGSDNLSSVFFGCVFGAVVGMPWLLSPAVTWSGPAVLGVLAIGFVQFGAAYVFMAEGLVSTPPLTASLLSMIEPILNPIWVALIVHERIGPLSLVGAVIVIAGAIGYNLLKAREGQGAK